MAITTKDVKEELLKLKKTVEANKDARWTFVCLHKPVWTAKDLAKNGWGAVEAVKCGEAGAAVYDRLLLATGEHISGTLVAMALQAIGVPAISLTGAQAGIRTDRSISLPGNVIEVHGNILGARCTRCGELYGLGEVGHLMAAAVDGVPRCTTTGCAFGWTGRCPSSPRSRPRTPTVPGRREIRPPPLCPPRPEAGSGGARGVWDFRFGWVGVF